MEGKELRQCCLTLSVTQDGYKDYIRCGLPEHFSPEFQGGAAVDLASPSKWQQRNRLIALGSGILGTGHY